MGRAPIGIQLSIGGKDHIPLPDILIVPGLHPSVITQVRNKIVNGPHGGGYIDPSPSQGFRDEYHTGIGGAPMEPDHLLMDAIRLDAEESIL